MKTNKSRMRNRVVLGIALSLLTSSTLSVQAADQKYFLVKGGQAQSVIVAPAKQSDAVKQAIDELQYHVERAAAIKLQVVDENKAKSLPADWVRISFIEEKGLPKETFKVKSQDNQLIFSADDQTKDALVWAVDHYLDTQWGVRWLWPGDVGTYVPENKDIALPDDVDVNERPVLDQRKLRIGLESARNTKKERHSPVIFLSEAEHKKQLGEANDWLRRFQNGSRSDYKFGHSFTKWWDKYGKDHPDYFAVPPEGSNAKQPSPRASRVKLNISNTKVDDQIIAEWKAAGAPDNWNVCPNDSSNFDTSPGSMAMDDPPASPEDVWRGRANLTARYVKFWNRLIPKMREINPNVSLSSYAYSAYRWAPINGLKLEPNIVLGFVPTFEEAAKEDWKGWQEAGAKLFLRPNWWHIGRVSPHLPLHKQGNFFKFGVEHNMVGFDSDSLVGDWGVQSPLYYTISRLMIKPDLSVDDIIDEYSSAFGNAAPDIKSYLKYWEDYSTELGFAYGNPVPGGLLDKITLEHNLRRNYLNQSWDVMPYVYTDEVLSKAFTILDQADKNASSDNKYVKERIQFLRDGLNHLKLTRDVAAAGKALNIASTQNDIDEYLEKSEQLKKMRKDMTMRHVMWAESLYSSENTRGATTIVEKVLDKTNPVRKYVKSKYTTADSSPLMEGWTFQTDPEDKGAELGYTNADFDANSWKSISSTDWWQKQGIEYHGVAWYRNTFQGKTLKEGESAYIYFGSIDGNAVIYLNGKQIGKHTLGKDFSGWDKAFTVKATNQFQPGENVLVVKVTSKSKDTASGITGGATLITGVRK